jgi:hypothetical protein
MLIPKASDKQEDVNVSGISPKPESLPLFNKANLLQ